MQPIEVTTTYNYIPQNLISEELEGIYGSEVLGEMAMLMKLYDVYEKGADFTRDTAKDYTPADLRYKQAAKLIDKEARFLFAKTPDVWVDVPYDETNDAQRKKSLAEGTAYQQFVDNVLKRNQFAGKLVQAAKDCFIARRVAYFINCNEKTGKITVDFVPSLEFIYETDPEDITQLRKIVTFYIIKDSQTKSNQRIYKKKYWMENGTCYLFEAVYDGTGSIIETLTPDRATKFTRIPAGVIINDGLTGDTEGRSEIELLSDFESWYSRIACADIDAERQGMNPVRWARDMDPNTTKGLSISAGAFWDVSTDPNAADKNTGELGVLETSMSYTAAVDSTLARLRSNMLEAIDVPDTSAEALKGVVSSGKTLRAIYWSLIVRCDEKMLQWRPALENIVDLVIQCGILYPAAAKGYINDGKTLPTVEHYDVRVENQYPLPDDEAEEKATDLAEVAGKTMSRKAYMLKWRNLTNKEADDELKQIALEQELDNSFGMPPVDKNTDPNAGKQVDADGNPIDGGTE